MTEVKGTFQATGHIFNKGIRTDSNTARLIYITVHLSTGSHYDTIARIGGGLADSDGIRTACAIIIVVSSISSRIYMEVVNLICFNLRGCC